MSEEPKLLTDEFLRILRDAANGPPYARTNDEGQLWTNISMLLDEVERLRAQQQPPASADEPTAPLLLELVHADRAAATCADEPRRFLAIAEPPGPYSLAGWTYDGGVAALLWARLARPAGSPMAEAILGLMGRTGRKKDPAPAPPAAPRRAPVQGDQDIPQGHPGREPGTITWAEHLEAWQDYARRYGSGQDAERVAVRGGFGYRELCHFLRRMPNTWEPAP